MVLQRNGRKNQNQRRFGIVRGESDQGIDKARIVLAFFILVAIFFDFIYLCVVSYFLKIKVFGGGYVQ